MFLTTSLLLFACGSWPGPDGGPTPTPTATPNPTTEVKITKPREDDKVKQTDMTKGNSQNIPSGQVIWIVVFVHKVGRYYPQNQPADVQANGDWDSVTYFGGPRDSGLDCDAIAVLADDAGQKAFNRYLTDAKDKNDWPGLERLPDGAKIYSRVSVKRE